MSNENKTSVYLVVMSDHDGDPAYYLLSQEQWDAWPGSGEVSLSEMLDSICNMETGDVDCPVFFSVKELMNHMNLNPNMVIIDEVNGVFY